MRLISCHIDNFGKINNFDMAFSGGLNVILEDNGWGKSTLAVFIRTMFYGFRGETKRNIRENERKAFRPWQGGVYGGNIVFEAGGTGYILTRIFKDKENEDIYELRNSDTNMLSTDFGPRIGEELFGLDMESFIRTVFIGQKDAVTHSTDSIDSKVGRLMDDSEDIAGFDDAVKLLTERMNRLNPGRATGSVNKRRNEITALERKIREGSGLEREKDVLSTKLKKEKEKLSKTEKELEENKELYKRATEKEHIGKLIGNLEENLLKRKKETESRRNFFTAGIPNKEELEEMLEISREMRKHEKEMSSASLSEDEKEKLNRLEERFETGTFSGSGIDGNKKNSEIDTEERVRTDKLLRKKKLLMLPVLLGTVMILTGVLFIFIKPGLFGPDPVVSGIMAAVFGAMFIIIGLYGRRKSDGELVVLKEKYEAVRELNRKEEERAKELYRILSAKEDRYDETVRAYTVTEKKLEAFFNKYRFNGEESSEQGLKRIRDRVYEYFDALKLQNESERNLKEFTEKNDLSLKNNGNERVSSVSELEKREKELEEELKTISKNINIYVNSLRENGEMLDELEENRRLLNKLKEEQEREKALYRRTDLAKKALVRAKENMTSRYIGPLLKSFKEYAGMITGRDTDIYHMDANTTLTLDGEGLQRKEEFFSEGLRDLFGVALRISLTDAMYKDETPFLVMDDPFVNLDDKKMKNAENFLEKLSAKYQIIYFTCSAYRS